MSAVQPESAWENVNKARRYNSHPCGIETKHVIRRLCFDLGSVFKYVVRREGKEPLRSLQSALFYLEDFWDHYDQCPDIPPGHKGVVLSMVKSHFDHERRPLDKQFYLSFGEFIDQHTSQTFDHLRTAIKTLIHEQEQADQS